MSAVFKAVIWDFDGTIADTRTAIIDAATHAMVSRGHPRPRPQQVTALVGLPIAELYRNLARDPGEAEVATLSEAHRSHFERHAPTTTTLFDGIATLLDDLARTGVQSALATSRTSRTLDPLMDHLGITDHFASVRTDDVMANPKPAPDMVLDICDELGLDTHEAVVVGDTAFDIEMGRRAGATTCGVTWGNHGHEELEAAGAHHVVGALASLQALLLADAAESVE